MKKKLWITTAAVSAVLLAGSVVYAAGLGAAKDTRPEQKVDAAAEAEQALLEAKEAKITETLSKLKVDANSEEAAILREVLQHKEMTAEEMSRYTSASAEFKKLTYEQAMAEYEKYAALTDMPWEEGKKTEGFSKNLDKLFAYEEYAKSIAVGEPLYQLKYRKLKDFAEGSKRKAIASLRYCENVDLEKAATFHQRWIDSFVCDHQKLNLSELCEKMLDVFAQRKDEQGVNFDALNADMEMLYQYLLSESAFYVNPPENTILISDIHDYNWIYDRYLAGESIQQIVG